jgi:alkylglycerol monooxygenase
MMEVYGKILLFATPTFLLLVLFEKWYGWRKGFDTVHNLDMISSMISGVTNTTKEVLGLSVTILSYAWIMRYVQLTTIHATWLTFVIAFVALDFFGYWTHRIAHKINFFWNYHLIHHSSEEFNLACALRQSISGFVNLFSFFLLPAALLGVPEVVIATVAPIHLFAQFWYHTRHIKKMGFLEHILVTPSHHRVHHAINPEYLDKNLAPIFIIWDKLFGTFQEELPDVQPVYGITRPVQTWNPIKINFQHWALLLKDSIRTKNWVDKFKVWFMPTGWRPKDVEEQYPVHKIDNPAHFDKYDTYANPTMKTIFWIQFIILLVFLSYFFGNIATIGAGNIFLYGGFIFLFAYALTDLMDGNKSSLFWEGLKMVFGGGLILARGDFFGLSNLIPQGQIIVIAYLLLSFVFTYYILNKEFVKAATVRI